jgi:hypothetical protein
LYCPQTACDYLGSRQRNIYDAEIGSKKVRSSPFLRHSCSSRRLPRPLPACRVCSRRGSRLAAKYGPEISLRDFTERFAYDCLWRAEARSKAGKPPAACTLPDLEQPRPPDKAPETVNDDPRRVPVNIKNKFTEYLIPA